jgi:hypothetical protein
MAQRFEFLCGIARGFVFLNWVRFVKKVFCRPATRQADKLGF